jgi:MFS family permease
MSQSAAPNLARDLPAPTDYGTGRRYYGWVVLWVAALAMVGTLPGRTQGLGLITEPLLKDLNLGRVEYANINLWATLIGSVLCVGVGRLQDRIGSRVTLAGVALALGAVTLGLSAVTGPLGLLILITLTRALGQSALSVVSLTLLGQWFRRRLDRAMGLFSVVMSMGFMIAFPTIGDVVTKSGWRVAWAGVGWFLLLALVPVALLFVRRPPADLASVGEGEEESETGEESGYTLAGALRTPAFWTMATASAVYGLIASGIALFNESVLKERGFGPGVYYNSLVLTALTSLVGNFLGGYLTARGGMNRLMAVAMALLTVALLALANVNALWQVMAVAVVMGVAGGFVIVLFFAFWGKVYGRAHLGQIQGAAQTVTVVASAVGPLLLAAWVERTGSYAGAFYLLAGVVALLAVAAWLVRVPGPPAGANR